MLEGDAKAFVEKAKAVDVTTTLYVAKERDHMGVVKSLLQDKSPVTEQVLVVFNKLKE